MLYNVVLIIQNRANFPDQHDGSFWDIRVVPGPEVAIKRTWRVHPTGS